MGVVATTADLALLALLVSVVGLAPRWASLPALLAGVVVQFVGNKWFAFGDRSRAWLSQLGWFALVEIVVLSTNAAAYDAAMRVLPASLYLPARLLTTTLVYFAVSLPLWSLIFRAPGSRAKAAR